MMDRSFISEFRIYYADTDAGGVVYHAQYLLFAERARSDLMRHLSLPLVSAAGDQFVTARANVIWKKPARLDDLVVCSTDIESIGGARVTMRHRFFVDDIKTASVSIEIVHVSQEHRPTRLSALQRQKFHLLTDIDAE